jgi:hypothetical protein
MKGIFWNTNGFKDPKKHKFLSDLISLLCLKPGEVTLGQDFSKAMCRKRLFMAFQRFSRSGGMLLGIDLQCYDIGGIDKGEFI